MGNGGKNRCFFPFPIKNPLFGRPDDLLEVLGLSRDLSPPVTTDAKGRRFGRLATPAAPRRSPGRAGGGSW